MVFYLNFAGNGILDQFNGTVQEKYIKSTHFTVESRNVLLGHLFRNGSDSIVIIAS